MSSRHRIRGPNGFTPLFTAGRRTNATYLQVLAVSALNSGGRLGISISKRSVKRAVDRNRIKRMLREIYRMERSKLQGFDVVLRLRRACQRAEFGMLDREARELLAKVPRQTADPWTAKP